MPTVIELESKEEIILTDMVRLSYNKYFLGDFNCDDVLDAIESNTSVVKSIKVTEENPVIFLLDLNKTLAEQCRWDWKTATYYPAEDIYSQALAIELQNEKKDYSCYIHLVTARGEIYQSETLKFIEQQLPGFVVDSCIFKKPKHKYVRVHNFKAEYVTSLLSLGVSPDNMFGIESNADTRREYKKLGVESQTRQDFLNDRHSKTQRLL